MALARALARPFWTCNSCRARYVRAFTSSSANELPRQRRRWQDLAPYRSDDAVTVEPLAPDHEMPTFEDDAFVENAGFGGLANTKDGGKSKRTSSSKSTLGKKPFKTDGLSNHSNKVVSQGLSIPAEFVDKEERAAAVEPEHHRAPVEQTIQKNTTSAEESAEKPMSDLPWYLQAQHQKPVSVDSDGPMAERQKLPDLPVHPPEHLEPILQHLSVEIGLDYLSILDLRKLDPPPALGNNLMMVVGTARGEKHLSVAAERFCAWLRREYKLHPYADGLVGRNELKIKQRRKAKKATALANAGAGANLLEELDDGIRTGWICVHTGYLNPHPEAPLKEVKRVNGMVGFGEEHNKITLVVQMFTEEKRNTVDLETLWKGILERNLRRQEHRAEEGEAASDPGSEELKPFEDGEEGTLTEQELKARKRFRLGNTTVLDGSREWETQNAIHHTTQTA